MRKILLPTLLLSSQLLFTSSTVSAEPFTACPTQAFLIQDAVARTYGVDLFTGEYGILQLDMGTRSKINGVGFNFHDNYIYGWDYANGVPGRIDSDFQITPLEVDNITGINFYVGDVALSENIYYVYSRNSGMYAIPLDPSDENYLNMTKVPDSSNIKLSIYDFAFHPTDGFAYTVDKNGNLYKLNVKTSEKTLLANTGESGTFGAVYFDVDGHLYFSRNNDGKVFRVDIDNSDYNAELFASGPASNQNDGARCAMAPIEDPDSTKVLNLDYGDAPESYGTLSVDNGPRHLLDDNTLYLGKGVDSESDGTTYPLSDDEVDGNDDEDGIQFASKLSAGDTAIVLATASESGFLSAWIDSNLNGVFDDDEQIITDHAVSAGTQPIYFTLPETSGKGSSWARFRISPVTGLAAVGGVTGGEVEDYPVDLIGEGASITHYPSASGWTTIAFEDNWPYEGDYDMNDMVVYLRTAMSKVDDKTNMVTIHGELASVGAAYHNGFAIRLPGILRDQINQDAVQFKINELPINDRLLLEQDSKEAILLIANDVWDYVTAGEDCNYYRSEDGCGSHIQMTFDMTIPFKEDIATDISGAFDPFMYATPGRWHGLHFYQEGGDVGPGRSYEIHVKNQSPTEKFNPEHFNLSDSDDASLPDQNYYYLTKNGLPWALEIATRWNYPIEYRDLNHAYPLFQGYVASDGTENQAWYTYKNAVESLLFTD